MNNYYKYENIEKELALYASPGIHPGLERISRLLALLGHPENSFPAIHVVGTNGKGSTSAYMESVLRHAELKTAMYTSPHLIHMGERLLINGSMLTSEEWQRGAEKVINTICNDKALSQDPPTYFEVFTAVAFVLIAEAHVDIAVIEAGMGGRLDATNTLGNVLLTVITSISMDHMDFLGTTLEAIAMEKFAVIREQTPAIFAGEPSSLISLFEKEADRKHSKGVVVSKSYEWQQEESSLKGSTFSLKNKNNEGECYPHIHTPLIGLYQIQNASLAIASLSILRSVFPQISEQALYDGLTRTQWAGRMELVPYNPPLLLDGAHNDDGIARLVESLSFLGIYRPEKKLTIVYGSMKDKEHNKALERLSHLRPRLICTEVPGMERSALAESLCAEASHYEWTFTPESISDPIEAIKKAGEASDIVVCCGSLYLIGYVRTRLMERDHCYPFYHETRL
ncbi:bifunctional folylpolyglutamate synthase/dihydrofolate synthase [Aminobacterium mobile]|uniref:bifunctional folylpolyglutamate synthase/dihydrofolate synthase n=1 Tax=Aminobacterium mobile TaxID=81467 RepID=UPI0033152E7E